MGAGNTTALTSSGHHGLAQNSLEFSTQGGFAPPPRGDIWQCLETFWHGEGGEIILVCSGWRPGMLLNALHHTGRPPEKKNPARNVAGAEMEDLPLAWIKLGLS